MSDQDIGEILPLKAGEHYKEALSVDEVKKLLKKCPGEARFEFSEADAPFVLTANGYGPAPSQFTIKTNDDRILLYWSLSGIKAPKPTGFGCGLLEKKSPF